MENDTGKAAMSPDQPFERSVVEWKQSKSEPSGRGGIDTGKRKVTTSTVNTWLGLQKTISLLDFGIAFAD